MVLYVNFTVGAQYLYPIAQIDDENILMMHQRSLDDLELWIWNRNQKLAIKELSSIFLPSEVQLLPGKTAYSFIDRGRIRVKFFNKRAPRAIDIYEPVHAIMAMTWISDDQFYFIGKCNNHYHMFLCNIQDRNVVLSCLDNIQDQLDYLSLYKIDDSLFSISKDQTGLYLFKKSIWNPIPYESYISKSSFEMQTLLSHTRSLGFLHMQNEKIGFCLEFNQEEKLDDKFKFSCCQIENIDSSWNLHKLFDFELPKKLLIDEDSERLHESISPFLPVYTSDKIYFIHYNQSTDQCDIFHYDLASKTIQQLYTKSYKALQTTPQHFFAPCIIENTIYCGISYISQQNRSLLEMDQLTGISKFFIPEIELQR